MLLLSKRKILRLLQHLLLPVWTGLDAIETLQAAHSGIAPCEYIPILYKERLERHSTPTCAIAAIPTAMQ